MERTMKRGVDVREIAGLVLCAVLSLMAFLALVLLLDSGLLPTVAVLIISLGCPLVWLVLLLKEAGGAGELRPARAKVGPARDRTATEGVVGAGAQSRSVR